MEVEVRLRDGAGGGESLSRCEADGFGRVSQGQRSCAGGGASGL